MLFEKDEGLEASQPRSKTLLISIGIHVLFLVFLALNPDLLTSTPKRIIKVLGQDYDLSKQELTELVVPPNELRPQPQPVPDKPLVQPPVQPEQQAPPPPPPQQQPPPPPPPPPQVIGPDDILKEGARPDAQARASRGDTRELARAGSPEEPKPEQQKQDQQANNPAQIARNNNPNALRVPSVIDSTERILQQNRDESRRRFSTQGPRTGVPNGQIEDPNFSTEEPTILSDTKGYDFGPYMNQVINRVRYNWYSMIPEVARLGKVGKVVIIFTIRKDGNIEGPQIAVNSGAEPLDRAAFGSITLSNPFAKLPAGFDGDHLKLQFTFLYNIK